MLVSQCVYHPVPSTARAHARTRARKKLTKDYRKISLGSVRARALAAVLIPREEREEEADRLGMCGPAGPSETDTVSRTIVDQSRRCFRSLGV